MIINRDAEVFASLFFLSIFKLESLSIFKLNPNYMRRLLIFLILIIISFRVSAQRKWEFKTKIVGNEYYLLEGKIDNKYPITMYLEKTNNYCLDEYDNLIGGEIAGWYYYKKIKKKIPLIGILHRNNSSNYLELFVPNNPTESLDLKKCDFSDYKEKFIVKECCLINEMLWQPLKSAPFKTFKTSVLHLYSEKSDAFLSFEIGGVEMININISKKSKVNSIIDFRVLASKKIGNSFYAIIVFGEASRSNSGGNGACSAGMEEYLGFIHINNKLEIQKFNFKHARSCLKNLDVYYDYDKKHPEKGVFIVDQYHDGPYE